MHTRRDPSELTFGTRKPSPPQDAPEALEPVPLTATPPVQTRKKWGISTSGMAYGASQEDQDEASPVPLTAAPPGQIATMAAQDGLEAASPAPLAATPPAQTTAGPWHEGEADAFPRTLTATQPESEQLASPWTAKATWSP
jgi:hypothetical protein